MAKGNMFLGMSRGSVGDVTFYRQRGNQIARARARVIKNPKSEAQQLQRMFLTTASRAYSLLKDIVDHSFQGVAYGQESQSFFLKENMNRLRQYWADHYPTAPQGMSIIGFSGVSAISYAGVGLLVSKGSLPSVSVRYTDTEAQEGLAFGSTLAGTTIQDVMDAVGAVRGDQITLCGLYGDGLFSASRYIINDDATDEQLAEEWDPTGAAAAFDPVTTNVTAQSRLGIDGSDLVNFYSDAEDNETLYAATVILSRKSGSSYLRSTQYLIANSWTDIYPMTYYYEEWTGGTVDIQTVSPYYLNQAEGAGLASSDAAAYVAPFYFGVYINRVDEQTEVETPVKVLGVYGADPYGTDNMVCTFVQGNVAGVTGLSIYTIDDDGNITGSIPYPSEVHYSICNGMYSVMQLRGVSVSPAPDSDYDPDTGFVIPQLLHVWTYENLSIGDHKDISFMLDCVNLPEGWEDLDI